jgi:hypothetical protein
VNLVATTLKGREKSKRSEYFQEFPKDRIGGESPKPQAGNPLEAGRRKKPVFPHPSERLPPG